MFSSWKQLKPERVIGRGGCGKVSLVKPTVLRSKSASDNAPSKSAGASEGATLCLAVKTVNLAAVTSVAKDEEERTKLEKMIFQEAELMKSLKHENIVKVFSSFLENGEFNMVMEYCECGSLKQTIDQQPKEQPFSEEQICDWMAQVAMTLLYLHEKRILHRDIKPENILLTNNNSTAKLSDFGIAKDLGGTLNKSAHTMIGTPTHMSPEVLSGESSYTYKSEVWALGVVLFELMTLKLPFSANPKAPTVTCVAVLTAEIPTVSTKLPYSQGLRDLLEQKMLIRKPELRFSMSQVVVESCLEEAVRKFTSKELQQTATMEVNFEERRLEIEKSLDRALKKIRRLEKHIEDSEVKTKQLIVANQQMSSEKMAHLESQLALVLTKLGQVEEKYECLRSLSLDDAKLKLFNAVWHGKIDLVHAIFRSKLIDVDFKFDMPDEEQLHYKIEIKGWNFDKSSALLYASSRGHLSIVKALLFDFNADVNATDAGDAASLHAAAYFGHGDIVDLLAQNGAVIDRRDINGNTALASASVGNVSMDVIEILVQKHKAKLEIKNNEGLTALTRAAFNGNSGAVKKLLELGANSDVRRDNGETALMLVAQSGHVEVAQLLVKRSPHLINAVTADGVTALMYASYAAKPEIVKLLLENGANPHLTLANTTKNALALAGGGVDDGMYSTDIAKTIKLLRSATSK